MTDFGSYGSSQLKFNGATLLQDQSKIFSQMKAKNWENRQSMPGRSAFDANSKWASGYNSVWGNGPPYPEKLYWSTLNQEIQLFPTGDCIRDVQGADPFTSWNSDGSLNIKPRKLTDAERATMTGQNTAVWNRVKLNSGAFCTFPFGFSAPYGVEIRCKMPKAKGTWPAFWLIPSSGAWPPELDVFEGVSGQLTTSIHSNNDTSWQQAAKDDHTTWVSGPGEGYPRATQNLDGDIGQWAIYSCVAYGDKIGIFVNRILRKQWQTPRDHNVPMHLMVNFAVGGQGDWPGTPPDPFADLGSLTISHIACWKFPSNYGQGTVPVDPINPQPIPPDPGPDPGPDPSPTPTNVTISVTGPDNINVSLSVNGKAQ